MTVSSHFDDFAPTLWSAAPATYPDARAPGMQGRWIITDAGVLWTDDKTSLGLETDRATDWVLVATIRATLVEQFALDTPVTEVFSRIQEELDLDEWFDGDLSLTDESAGE